METINLSKLISWLDHNKLISDSILYFELIQGLTIKLFVSRREEKLNTIVSTVFRFHQLQVYIHRTCCRVEKNKHPKYEREVRYIFLFQFYLKFTNLIHILEQRWCTHTQNKDLHGIRSGFQSMSFLDRVGTGYSLYCNNLLDLPSPRREIQV